MPTPTWSAGRAGLLGDNPAVNASAQINQFLGTHGITPTYYGNNILAPFGTGGVYGFTTLNRTDLSQPFVLVGTAVGRVTLPIVACGTGADLLVSLCADNAGVPGTVITQTRVPASWFYQQSALAAVGQTSFLPAVTELTGNPLATGDVNGFHLGVTQNAIPWPFPSLNGAGGAASPSCTFYGNYMIQVGGVNASNVAVNNTFTIFYDGAGNLSRAVPQAAFPTASDGSGKMCPVVDPASGAVTVVIQGGGTTFLGATTSAVYTASLDPDTGVLSAWTVQQPLPYTIQNQATVGYNGYIYVIGGQTAVSGPVVNSVSYAQVQNGIISAWNTGPNYPIQAQLMFAGVSNGYLIVCGGTDFTQVPQFTNVYYSAINADGSLAGWNKGPSMTGGGTNLSSTVFSTDFGIIVPGHNAQNLASLGVSPYGLATEWREANFTAGQFSGFLPLDDGTWLSYHLGNTAYSTAPIYLQAEVSIPLTATGLTNGATYHVVMQQTDYTDQNNYLRASDDFMFGSTTYKTLLFRNSTATSWTSRTGGVLCPIRVYDNATVGQLLHLVDDGGARVTSVITATSPAQNVIGVIESTKRPPSAMNANWQFTTGLAPWGVTHGTAVPSTAQTQGNLPQSILLTPSGVDTQAYIECEKIAVRSGRRYGGSAWVYSPTGYSNVSVILNWYDATNTFISSVFGTVTSVAANTWTFLSVDSGISGVPNNAVNGTMGVYEKGTPPASAQLYISAAPFTDILNALLSSVAQVTYNGVWPSQAAHVPTGTVQLA